MEIKAYGIYTKLSTLQAWLNVLILKGLIIPGDDGPTGGPVVPRSEATKDLPEARPSV